jgi:hypothetical protein
MPIKKRKEGKSMPKVNPSISDMSADFYEEKFRSRNAGCEYFLDAIPSLYKHTMWSLKGRFDGDELKLIVDLFNSTQLSPSFAGQQMNGKINDGVKLDGMDKKYDVNGVRLMEKIDNLTLFERACLELWANGYWYANDELPDLEGYINSLIADKEKEEK